MAMGFQSGDGERFPEYEETVDGRLLRHRFPVVGVTDFVTYPDTDVQYKLLKGEGSVVLPLEFSERVLLEGSYEIIRAGLRHQLEGRFMLIEASYEPPLDPSSVERIHAVRRSDLPLP